MHWSVAGRINISKQYNLIVTGWSAGNLKFITRMEFPLDKLQFSWGEIRPG